MRIKDPRQHDERHLAFIRLLPCLVTLRRPVEAAHVRYACPAMNKRAVGMGEKPSDKYVVPMHPEIHRRQHEGNERAFWGDHGIDPLEVARELYAASGDVAAGEEIVHRFSLGRRWPF